MVTRRMEAFNDIVEKQEPLLFSIAISLHFPARNNKRKRVKKGSKLEVWIIKFHKFPKIMTTHVFEKS